MKIFLLKTSLLTIIVLLLVSFFGGTPATVEAAPKPSNTPRPTATSKPTKTTKPTNTPRFTFTPTATFTATQTPTSMPTDTPTATQSPTTTPTSVPANLLAYWKFDEGSGNTVADSSGNGYALELFNGASWTDASAPTTSSNPFALRLSSLARTPFGASTDTIDLVNKSFSVDMWAARYWVDRYYIGPTSFFFTQGCILSGCSQTDQILSLSFGPSDNFICGFGNDDLITPATTSDGNWHHYACTYDAVNSVRKAYKDGVLVGSDTPLGNDIGNGPFRFGYKEEAVFTGLVDEARMYDAALSGAQVAALAERDPAYTPAPCTPRALFEPADGLKPPQNLQLQVTDGNGCGTPEWVTAGAYTYTWGCYTDTSTECPNFLASANALPNGKWNPTILIQDGDVIHLWVTYCLADTPWLCSAAEHYYTGAPLN